MLFVVCGSLLLGVCPLCVLFVSCLSFFLCIGLVCRLLLLVCCLWFVVCRVLFVVWCLACVAGHACVLFVIRCLLDVAGCVLSVVLLFVVCCVCC